MKVAIVHEWLVNYAGSERVLEQMLHCYPQADIFCVVDFVPEHERQRLLLLLPNPCYFSVNCIR